MTWFWKILREISEMFKKTFGKLQVKFKQSLWKICEHYNSYRLDKNFEKKPKDF